MFVFTVHKPKRKLLFLLLPVLSVLLAGLLLLLPFRKNRLTFNGISLNVRVQSEGDVERIASFLCIDIVPETLTRDTVYIPVRFNALYDAYDRLQEPLGLSLFPYRGRQADRYTADLADGEQVMTLLVCDGRLIGGDLCSRDFFGEQLPLSARMDAP